MSETLKRRIMFFCLPVLTAFGIQAALAPMGYKNIAILIAGLAAAIVAFVTAFFRLDDRDCVIMSETFKPAMIFAVPMLAIAVATAGYQVYAGLCWAMFATFAGFAGAESIAPYVSGAPQPGVQETRCMLAASVGQMAVLAITLSGQQSVIPAISAGLALISVVYVRFWKIRSPSTEVSA